MPSDPPIGSPPADICAPCSGPPLSIEQVIAQLQARVCSLDTNYQATLQRYNTLRKSLESQGLVVKDVQGDIDRLEQELLAENGTDCSRLAQATAPAALIVCEGGVQKAMSAPANDGFTLISSGGLWKANSLSLGLIRQPVQQQVLATGNLGPGSHDTAVTLPNFPTFTQQVWACFGINIVGLPSGSGSTNLSFNGVGIGHTGSGAEDNLFDVFVQLGGAGGNFNLTSAGSIVTMSANVILKFYDYR